MARLSHVVLIIAMNALMCILAEEETYPKQHDNIDVQAILQDNDLREDYYKCFMEITPCKTLEMKTITKTFRESIQTKCKKCTKKQKENIELIKDWYLKNLPDVWQQILAKSTEDMQKSEKKN